jgi:RNA polymerase sigma-70 factor (ECF subfamily)
MRLSAEATVLAQLREGDESALETVLAELGPAVYRVARGITGSDPDAEEVVQDVFLSVFRKIGSFEERSGLSTWIYRVAVNAALIKRRSRGRACEVPIEDYLPTFTDDGHRAGDRSMLLADWSQSPESELLTTETQALVRSAIASLPEPYQVVLTLRDMAELSSEETADALGESVACVKSRLHRARMALREQLTRALA